MASLTPSPKMQFFDANGNPLVGGKLYTYAAGTTTPLATYTDYGGGTPNTNPVIMDSRGEASVWLGTSRYYMELKDSTDVLIWSSDNIGGFITTSELGLSTGSTVIGDPASAYNAGTTVYSHLIGLDSAVAALPTKANIQSSSFNSAVAGGTADAITGTFTPAIAALPTAPGTLTLIVRAGAANATATPTFQANATVAKTIVKGSNSALVAGDIPGAGYWMELQYDATLDKYVLQNPALPTGAAAKGANSDITSISGLTTPLSVAQGGTGVTAGPAFSAIQTTAQNHANGTAVDEATLYTKRQDTGNYFNATTGRFTPLISGYYSVFATANSDATLVTGGVISIRLNASDQRGSSAFTNVSQSAVPYFSCSALIYMNGTTDYISVYAGYTGGSAGWVTQVTDFSGFLARSA